MSRLTAIPIFRGHPLETIGRKAHRQGMDQDRPQAPAFWAHELSRSDQDIAAGNVVAAEVVHHRLRTALAELEAELAAESDAGRSILAS